jgi:hypothetical protein
MTNLNGIVTVVGLLAAGVTFADEIPTFDKLDQELGKYAKRAELEGETHAQMSMDGLPYYCMFDLFLTVMAHPEHPKHAETKGLFAQNLATLKGEAGLVSMVLGRNVLTLMCMANSKYCEGFKKGAEKHAPDFKPESYRQPCPRTVGEGDDSYTVAWYHAQGDADGDGVSNRDELKSLAPHWQPVKNEEGTVKEGTGLGVTEVDRDAFVERALGVESWRVAKKAASASK